MERFSHDVIVIGCGAAGLRAAIAAAEAGLDVCVLSKAGRGLGTRRRYPDVVPAKAGNQ